MLGQVSLISHTTTAWYSLRYDVKYEPNYFRERQSIHARIRLRTGLRFTETIGLAMYTTDLLDPQ